MIDLTNITHINIYSAEYLPIQLDLIELNRKLPEFNWCVDYDYTGSLRIDCINTVSKDIRFYWDEDCNIICIVDDFEVAANCTMEETIEELKDYLASCEIIKIKKNLLI
jgi:hypothetical protein